jgi:hypothetical protein
MDPTGRTRALVEAETGALVGRLAAALAAAPDRGLPAALDLLVTGLGLHSAVLRSAASAELLGVAGEVVHAVPLRRTGRAGARPQPSLELPVHGVGGRELARLTVVGGRPSHLPALRASAAVLGLALEVRGPAEDRPPVSPAVEELLRGGEHGLDDVADQLHDGPVQALVAARYACDVAVRGGSPTDARDAVQEALVALRRSLWHLRPRGEDDLPAALEQLSHRLAEGGRPGLLLSCDHPSADLLGPAARTTAYRLVQSVALAERDAPVRVAVRRSGDTVVLHVDGGAPLADPDRWVRRARALGGDLSSSAGRLRLVLPAAAPLLPSAPAPDPKALP